MSVKIRTATPQDADDIARVHVTSWEENYRGMLSDEMIAARSLERRRAQWAEILNEANRVTFVVEEDGRIVAFASSVVLDPPQSGYTAYLQTIYMIAQAKRGGIGKALLSVTAEALMERGCTNLALRTLRLNPARGFYEHLGARLVPEGLTIDDGMFDDVVYGFDDIGSLLAPAL